MPDVTHHQAVRRPSPDVEAGWILPERSSVIEGVVLLGLFAYLTWFRLHGLPEEFFLMGEQMRDWDVARRQLQDLPLSGVPSTAGGTTLGPAYYWILWLIARIVGPATGDLPHAGGIGISLLQGYADVILAWALARRTGSLVVATTIALLAGSSVDDAVLSSTIWNPPVAVAFVKMCLAFVLIDNGRPISAVAVALTGWIAVQCHTSAMAAVAPLLAWTTLVPAARGGGRAGPHGGALPRSSQW